MIRSHALTLGRFAGLCAMTLLACGLSGGQLCAQQAAAGPTNLVELNKALADAKGGDSEARQRLAIRRVIRDAEQLLAAHPDGPVRFELLEFLFRARQQLIAFDKDPQHRKELLDTCRELVKAPDEQAALRLEADLLLSQAELAKQGADSSVRAQALMPLVERYLNSPVGAKVMRMAMVMALELGDSRVVFNLQERMVECFPADLDMIAFQRDKLGGQVIGAPLSGVFERSDGSRVRFPMEVMGRSTLMLFWSKDEEGMTFLKQLAATALTNKDEYQGRLDFVSFNLDDLPDAGESIVRGLGVNWQCLRLPGGRKNPIYDAFSRIDPRMVSSSPNGYCALIMTGSDRQKTTKEGAPDYGRMIGSNLSRSWNDLDYVARLRSLSIGEFLVIDPEGPIDPARPPEWKSLAMGKGGKPLTRDGSCVPEETLRDIQQHFVPPPQRLRVTLEQSREHYTKAVELCRAAIAAHPQAPDLWLVRNRLMVALMGLWKADGDHKRLDEACAEAATAMQAGYPEGCNLLPRFCIARASLRNPEVDAGKLIDAFVQDSGESAAGPALAAASLLALDTADRLRFNRFRKLILERHTEYPAMWTYTAFLLDRHQAYWLFQMPFTAGWSYSKREGYFKSHGDEEEARRMLQTELRTLDGKAFRIPQDLDSEWTALIFSKPGPWSPRGGDGTNPSPLPVTEGFAQFAATRPTGEVKVLLVTLGGEPEAIRKDLETLKDAKRKVEGVSCPVLILPDGINNPLVQRLGLVSEDSRFNTVLLHRDGRIAVMLPGEVAPNGKGAGIAANVIEHQDEQWIMAALERGEVEKARERILKLAPPIDPNAVDEKGRKLRPPSYSNDLLRARARVYMALKEWDKALADAEQVVSNQLGTDGGMSLRTPELDESEALRDEIQAKMKQ